MILPCEIAVKSVVPAVKALMTQQLVEERGMKQDQVAGILGISQSAVSKYGKKVRGYVLNLEEMGTIQPLISGMIDMLMDDGYQRAEFLRLFCQACQIIRRTGLVCDFCKRAETRMNITGCGFCTERVT